MSNQTSQIRRLRLIAGAFVFAIVATAWIVLRPQTVEEGVTKSTHALADAMMAKEIASVESLLAPDFSAPQMTREQFLAFVERGLFPTYEEASVDVSSVRVMPIDGGMQASAEFDWTATVKLRGPMRAFYRQGIRIGDETPRRARARFTLNNGRWQIDSFETDDWTRVLGMFERRVVPAGPNS